MHSSLRAATAAAAAACALAVAAAPASAAPPTDSSSLRSAVTAKNVKKHLSALQSIANMNGGTRASGTPGYDASLAYVKSQLDATGYFTTTVQKFDFDSFRSWRRPSSSASRPIPRDFVANDDFITMDYSGTGDVTGTLVPTNDIVIPPGAEASTSNSGCEPADFAPASADRAPGRADPARHLRLRRSRRPNAQAAGYDAVDHLQRGSARPPGDAHRHARRRPTSTIPVIGTIFAIGEELYNQAQAGDGHRPRGDHDRDPTTRPDRQPASPTTKTGRTDRRSWSARTSTRSRRARASTTTAPARRRILEIALQMAELGIKPRNQVRFAFWGAEESGLIGSQYYVDSLTSRQIKDIAVNLNFDMVGSPNFVRFVYDGDASDTDVARPRRARAWSRTCSSTTSTRRAWPREPTAFDGRSDYDAFISVGIPAGGLFTGAEDIKTAEQAAIYGGTAGVAYDPCYHQACDTINNVSTTALDQMSDAVGARDADVRPDRLGGRGHRQGQGARPRRAPGLAAAQVGRARGRPSRPPPCAQ